MGKVYLSVLFTRLRRESPIDRVEQIAHPKDLFVMLNPQGMEIIKTKNLSESQYQQIHDLWNEEFPIQLKDRFGLLLNGVRNYHHYIIEENDRVLAWAVEFEKDNETRFSILVRKEYQGKGWGSMLLDRLKQDLGEFFGWVIDHGDDIKQNGEVYTSPLSFYTHRGFEVLRDQRIDSEMIRAVKIRSR